VALGTYDSPEAPAVFTPDRRVFVNHDVFYFSSAAAAKRFAADPLRWCAQVRDPVTSMWFEPSKGSPRREHDGRIFYFSSDSTSAVFAGIADSLSVPRSRMVMVM